MIHKYNFFFILYLFIITSPKFISSKTPIKDPSSYSNTNEIIQKEIFLNLNIDFNTKSLAGYVEIKFEVLLNTSLIVLDGRDLNIKSVINKKNIKNLYYSIEKPFSYETLGNKIKIYLDREYIVGEEVVILIQYSTTRYNYDDLVWVDKNDTKDKILPFFFTQCETVRCRSILPSQDTPSIKVIVKAMLTAKSEFEVLFGGIKKSYKEDKGRGLTIHYFEQLVPIPNYLISIVVGKIEGKEIPYKNEYGIKLKVWSEPSNLDCAYLSYKEILPEYINIANNFLFPYEWGVYDMIFLPEAFQYGGMENPNLTFLAQNLLHCYISNGELVADISKSYIIAHELSHSWTGNLVSNANWNHFWLNEGFTVFFERKIIQKYYGYDMRLIQAEDRQTRINGEVDKFLRIGKSEYTKLRLTMSFDNPDDTFSILPYEKGYALLHNLEKNILKNEDHFQEILKAYINKYRRGSAISSDFIEVFEMKIEEIYKDDKKKLDEIKSQLNWNGWLDETGYPKLIINDYSNSLSLDCINELNLLIKNGKFENSFISKFKNWVVPQKNKFLVDFLNRNKEISQLKENIIFIRNNLSLSNDSSYSFDLKSLWIRIEFLLKKDNINEIYTYLHDFLIKSSENYIVGIYNRWAEFDYNGALAEYKINRNIYSINTINTLDRILKFSTSSFPKRRIS